MSGIAKLTEAGVSVWLDDLSRELIQSGGLSAQIANGIRGLTSNPSIFEAAVAHGSLYDLTVEEAAKAGATVDEAIRAFTVSDIQSAADLFAQVYKATDGVDGRVSLEVDPRLARDTDGTVAQAKELADAVNRPNLMVKIPATAEGVPAITATLGSGISVNVTLIFSIARYKEVIDAWLSGLEAAQAAGHDLSKIESVASFFVSRVDTAIDSELSDEHAALRGKAGVANAVVAYQVHLETLQSERWLTLEAAGARPQRPLWASTGVKNPDYPDTLYVDSLVAPGTVNTMPPKTIQAADDHVDVSWPITARFDEAAADLAALDAAGIDLDAVTQTLEDEAVTKFVDAWESLRSTVEKKMHP